MAQIVLLQWERRRLCGCIAESEHGSMRVQETFTHAWPAEFDPLQSPAQAGDKLRGLLKNPAVPPERVIVCLSREDVILRHLEVPDVPDEELPDLVKFQAAARSTTPLEQLALDYLPLEKSPGGHGRPVLALTASRAQVDGVQAVLRAAGLAPAAITFSSIGLAEFIAHVSRPKNEPAPQTMLGAWLNDERVELVIVTNNRLQYAHSARLPHEEGTASNLALLPEISRTIVAAQRLHPQLQIDRAYVVGTADDALLAALNERIGAPAERVDAARISAIRETQAKELSPALIGLAAAEADHRTAPFDFLHPRQPPAKVNLRKQRLAVGAAAALLVAALFFGVVEGTRGSLLRELDALQQREIDLDSKIKPGEATLAAANQISQWQAASRNQLQQMSALEALMEGTDRMYLSQYAFTAGQGESAGNLQATGNAKSREDVLQLQQRMIDSKSYSLQPRQLTQTSNDDEYAYRFEINANLLAKPAALVQPSTPNPQPTTR